MTKVNAGAASQAHFARIPSANVARSRFHRPSTYKTTMDAGYLVPFFIDEVLPGDTFEYSASLFGRLSTPIVPFMDDLWIDTHFFFVPNRLIFDNWEKLQGAQDNPGDSIDYLTPVVDCPLGGWTTGSLSDYFGIPTGVDIEPVCSFWHRAYNLIWNEWFRDENLQDSVPVPKGDGPDKPEDFQLLKRGKRKDYFTSALPWPQKGPGVELPLGSTAPLITDFSGLNSADNVTVMRALRNSGDTFLPSSNQEVYVSTTGRTYLESSADHSLNFDVTPYTYADLSNASPASIETFRMAFQMQMLLEQFARSGTRYFEILQGMWSVTNPDLRLQRPEYLGGSSCKLGLQAVPQTASTDSTTPQGNLAAYGMFNDTTPHWKKSFGEHGVVIGLVSVRSNLTYQQGINRMFSRRTRYDFFMPLLAHLGEQAILNKEIYADGTEADQEVFGYQERWSEYRYGFSKVTGKLRSSDPQSLDIWHLSQDFETRPVLSADFIEENPPLDRVLAVTDEPQIIFDCYNNLYCVREMPTYSVPGLVTHF